MRMQLEADIKRHAQLYYEGKLEISDEDFDNLVAQLRLMDPSNPLLTKVGWGYDLNKSKKKKVAHLGNCYGISDKRFVETEFDVRDKGSIITGKMDGGNVELIYRDGLLIRALTRGDGSEGFDVTHILQHIVPARLNMTYSGDIVGEFIIPESNYDKFDSDSVRNIPNGYLMRDNTDPEECKLFSFVPYKIYKYKPFNGISVNNKLEVLDLISRLGFNTISRAYEMGKFGDLFRDLKVVTNPDGSSDEYSLDGVVVTSNDIMISPPDEDGYVEIAYNEYALKTRTDMKDTRVTHIRWNLTRTGRIVPTVNYEPIFLSGATCSNVLAHNAQYIVDNKIAVGSVIKVVRSGEVIPYIMEVVQPKEAELPQVCPICGFELKWKGKDLICDNPDCEGQSYSRVCRWLSVLGGVHNLGGSLMDDFIEKYEIDDISDIYEKDDVSFDSLYEIDGIGRAKVQLIVDMYKRLYEEHSLAEYIIALSISGLGWKAASKIAEETDLIDHLDDIGTDFNVLDMIVNQISQIKGLGPAVSSAFLNAHRRFVDNLKYIKISKNIEKNESNSNDSDVYKDRLRIYVTGKLEKFKSRGQIYQEFSNIVEECKDIKNCDYFVTNKQPLSTNHYKQAIENGINVINEDELLIVLERRLSEG